MTFNALLLNTGNIRREVKIEPTSVFIYKPICYDIQVNKSNQLMPSSSLIMSSTSWLTLLKLRLSIISFSLSFLNS